MNNRRKKLLSTLISAAILTLLITGIVIRRNIPNGGELTPNYELLRSLDEPLKYLTLVSALAFPISFTVAISTFIRISRTQLKLEKYKTMRKLTLWVAAIPGIVVLPFLLAMAVEKTPLTAITPFLAIFTISSLIPGGMGMITLASIATIKAIRTPLDPDSPTPKKELIQIWLASLAAAMPTIAFLSIFTNAFKCDTQVCTPMFQEPLSQTLGAAYLAIWLVQGIIWMKMKQNHGKLDS